MDMNNVNDRRKFLENQIDFVGLYYITQGAMFSSLGNKIIDLTTLIYNQPERLSEKTSKEDATV